MMALRWSWGLGLLACSVPLAGQQLDAVGRARLASGIWSVARYNAPGWASVEHEWDSAFVAVLAAAALRQTDVAYFHRLRRFVAILEDGQAALRPPNAVAGRVARPPIALRGVERRPFLVDYIDTDEMLVARPQRDAEIVAVQGIPATQWIRDSILPEISGSTEAARWERAIGHMLEGAAGTAVHLELRLPGGERRGASVTRSVPLNDRWPLEPPPLRVDTLPDDVVWVRLSSFADASVSRAFDRAFPDWSGVRGLILDLRENAGRGERSAGYAILGRLLTRPLITARWRALQYRPSDAPDSSSAWLLVPPDTLPARQDLPAYDGPVAILTSSRTAAAAEALLVAFRNAGRGPIVGQPSAGSTGRAVVLRPWKGWGLRLAVTREEFPDGTAINGTGVAPELPVEEKVSDFLAGRDAALERAREYIDGRIGG
jgi:carboxyl-terminal processing protease